MSDRDSVHAADLQAVRATLQWGVRLTLAIALAGFVYATFAPALEHRGLLIAIFLSAVPVALGVSCVPAERLTASGRVNAFFAAWSFVCIAQVSIIVGIDGAGGPLATLFFLPLLFVVMAYPMWLVGALGAVTVGGYTAIALVQDDVSTWAAMFYAVALAWTGVYAVVATREQRRQRATIASLSLRDPLTDLPNRALLLERLDRAVAGHRAAEESLAVIFFDLDDFKVVNDSLGHPAGDSLLRQVVERLQRRLRSGHLIARFGGDEFVVVCERLRHPAEAVMIAERLAESIRSEPFVLEGHEHHVTASVGVATNGTGATDADTLIRDADAAMYRAKESGRGRVEIFDDLLRRRIVDRVGLERDLRRAIDGDELFVVYQPIIALDDPRPRAEALVRWNHPERGIVPPGDFIGVAEDSGLIHELGERVLHIACAQAAEWRLRGGRFAEQRISVNVSARQLADGGFPSRVARVLAQTGMDPSGVVLEITESAILDDVDGAGRRLQALRALGVSISLDDFGTGHSSVTSLLQLPLVAIKLDRTFVAGVGEDPAHTAVIKGLVAMATDLGLHTIVEGVETAGQLALLESMGCRNFQGYYFSRPVSAEDYVAWALAA
jgi:diguanylate cyclase (GGDEF)-like protein